MRVAELIRSRIESGELPPGTKVSHTAYAVEFGVSRETVKRACGKLAEFGILQHGHGHRVAPEPSAGNGWLFLRANRPEEVAIALREAMTDDQVAALMAALVADSWRQNPVVT
ncbi:GntR family transcriptional regulator [Streptomyces luteolifulvus]|uniref:GntR family transcriptional regulator n=2 Tax=Streptomyces luteolifulvus TaxID=2615112 RepID=A0A6H9V390_9ACTN|nr:GntR family transcriptional regulator [Streptomyces luteolifulvus]